MAQVSNQAELQSALNSLDSSIQVTSGFTIVSQINISYAVTIESSDTANPAVLTKDGSYFAYLFRVSGGGALTLRNIILDGNKADHPEDNTGNRSLIYVTGGALNLSGGSILRGNHSYLEGGAVYLNSSSSYSNAFSMSGNALVTGCSSRTNGGGIMLAHKNPGDIFAFSGDASIDGNSSAYGGGLYYRVYEGSIEGSLTVGDRIHIVYNTASSAGGGIYFSGYREGTDTSVNLLELSGNALLSGNQAINGAGIYFYAVNPGDEMAASGSVVIAMNTASQNGGGFYMTAPGAAVNLSLDSVFVTDNTAGTGGGGYILTNAGDSVAVNRCTITGNRAINSASGTGGGLWLQNQSQIEGISFDLSHTALNNNQSSVHGGGLALYGGGGNFRFQMTGGSVSDNKAGMEGGGAVISHNGKGALAFYQAAFINNTAGGSGGGIYYAYTGNGEGAELNMTETVLMENTAEVTGGGLRLASGNGPIDATLTDCNIISNVSRQNSGGGIWNGGGNVFLTLDGGTSVSQNSSETGNGGGIYFNSDNGKLLLAGNAKIMYNSAEGEHTGFGSHGGGICLVPGALTIQEQAEIAFNRAGKYGGGVSAAESSLITMEGGSIHDNTSALFGGGIWIHDSSSAALTGGAVTGNVAPYGGGIFNDSYLFAEGERNISGGIYIANRTAVVRLTNALPGTSSLQLEVSDYVSPSGQTAIVVGEATESYPLLTQQDADAFLKPVRDFDGWEIRLSSDYTKVLLAPVSYRIDYENLMGASNPNPEQYTTVTPDITLMPPGAVYGYRFAGWFDAPSGGNQVTVIPKGSTGNLTLYAGWEAVTVRCTITFCGNDTCCSRACHIPKPITVPAGENALLPEAIPQRRGYCFLSWDTDPRGGGISYLPGETVPSVESDICLYAVWIRNCC